MTMPCGPGVVLRRYPFDETHCVAVLLTRDWGLVRAVARGVRRHGSRLAAGLTLFSLTEFQFHCRARADLWRVIQAQTVRTHRGLSSDLDRLGRAARLAELVQNLTPEHEPQAEIFSLLVSAFGLLDAGADHAVIGPAAEILLLDRLGYHPRWERCGACGGETGELAYSPENGDVRCRGCRPAGGIGLAPGDRRFITHVRRRGLTAAVRLKADPVALGRLHTFLDAAWQGVLGRPLKSDAFRRAVGVLPACLPESGRRAPQGVVT